MKLKLNYFKISLNYHYYLCSVSSEKQPSNPLVDLRPSYEESLSETFLSKYLSLFYFAYHIVFALSCRISSLVEKSVLLANHAFYRKSHLVSIQRAPIFLTCSF